MQMLIRISRSLAATAAFVTLLAIAGCQAQTQTPPQAKAPTETFERPVPPGPEGELQQEVFAHLKTLDNTGKVDAKALDWMNRIEKAQTVEARAKLGAFLKPAVDRGAMTKGEARERLMRMANQVTDESERKMFRDMADIIDPRP